MYKKIMVPVDLEHADKLSRAIDTATDLSKYYKIPVIYVAVTASLPSAVAHNPAEYETVLKKFAAAQSELHGIEATAKAYFSHDPAVDLDETLLKAIHETGSDLVVMASHIPNVADHVWPSNGGTIASRSDVSVFIVRQ
jgi:nucleotide-binding universal stress UspA family protein